MSEWTYRIEHERQYGFDTWFGYLMQHGRLYFKTQAMSEQAAYTQLMVKYRKVRR